MKGAAALAHGSFLVDHADLSGTDESGAVMIQNRTVAVERVSLSPGILHWVLELW